MAFLLFFIPVVVFEPIFPRVMSSVLTTVPPEYKHSGYFLPWHFYSSLYQWWDLNTFSLGYKSYVLPLYHQGTTILATWHHSNSTILNAHLLIQNPFTWIRALHFTTLPLGHNHSCYLLPWQSYASAYQWWYSNSFFLGLRILFDYTTLLPKHNDSGYQLSWQFYSSLYQW